MKEALLYTLFFCFTLIFIAFEQKNEFQTDSEISLLQRIELVKINRNVTQKINLAPKKLLPSLDFFNTIKPNLCQDAIQQRKILSPLMLKAYQEKFFDIKTFFKFLKRITLRNSEDKQDSHNLA